MKQVLYLKKVRFSTLMIAVIVAISSTQLQAQGLAGIITSAMGLDWLKALITAGIGMWALHEIVSNWESIFGGGAGTFKTIVKIVALIGLMIWWQKILVFLLSVGNW